MDPAITARLLFGMVNSIVEWYRPDRKDGVAKDTDHSLARAITTVAFDGLRIRR